MWQHRVDGVRGTPTLWRPGEVKRADVTTSVLATTADSQTLAFTIDFSMRGKRRAALGERELVTQGYQGQLVGQLTIDLKTK